MLSSLGTLIDLLTVVIGFGLIVFLHELGHFLAARWAGIRVLAFALGFGPAAVSYRRGMGFRRGSSEAEYRELLRRNHEGTDAADVAGISPTEYRINYLPLGGYVKMLGQEDLNPGAVSDAADSYQSCKPTKRMVVISAGVIMNLVSAAILFVIVFLIGRQVSPPVAGYVLPDAPAAGAVAINADELGIEEPGLRSGDRILSVNGRTIRTFDRVRLATAMAGPNDTIDLEVERAGVSGPLIFRIKPERSEREGLFSLGVFEGQSLTLHHPRNAGERDQYERVIARAGLDGVPLGSAIVSSSGSEELIEAQQLDQLFAASAGQPVELVWETPEGLAIERTVAPRPAFQESVITLSDGSKRIEEHLLGLTPLMSVAPHDAPKQGLEAGDLFLRIGEVEFPSVRDGINAIRASKGETISLEVLRGGAIVELEVTVNKKNATVGFLPWRAFEERATLGAALTHHRPEIDAAATANPAAGVLDRPGWTITRVEDTAVESFDDVRAALRVATVGAYERGEAAEVRVELAPPSYVLGEQRGPGGGVRDEITWTLGAGDIRTLHELGWESPISSTVFEPLSERLQASNPLQAVAFGLDDTRSALINTYLTFARLAQGTVQVTQLKGPVGIAHVGTLIADRGLIWLLWFLALISVNLAVINFLPLPIVDGGQFLMLLYEQLRGKPVPLEVQGAVTTVGLLMMGAMFIFVTFNDVRSLLGF